MWDVTRPPFRMDKPSGHPTRPARPELSGGEVLALERRSRSLGSGLTRERVQGCWRLDQLWSKHQAQPQAPTAALLRALRAGGDARGREAREARARDGRGAARREEGRTFCSAAVSAAPVAA